MGIKHLREENGRYRFYGECPKFAVRDRCSTPQVGVSSRRNGCNRFEKLDEASFNGTFTFELFYYEASQ